jgi:OOP family OmpA-OmpF porin
MRTKLVATFSLCLMSGSALAGDTGPYLGGGLGLNLVEDRAQEIANAVGSLGLSNRVTQETGAAGFRLYGGYRLHRNFGVELGYANLGKYDIEIDVTSPVSGRVNGDWKASAFDVVAVGFLPFSESLSGVGRLGASRWSAKFSASGPGGSVSATSNGWSPLIGVGLLWSFSANWGLRTDFDYRSGIGDENKTGQTDVSTLGVSVQYMF